MDNPLKEEEGLIVYMSEQSERVVRNIAIVAHVDHGKTTLTDSLVKKAGLSNKENALDRAHPDQIERNITIKSTGAALQFGDLSVNLIDSPGHVDFSSEVSSALRLSDGACVVVDCASGVKVQTITVLKQALAEAVVPVLVLNKFDRLIVELRLSPEEVFARLSGIIDQINDIIATYAPAAMPSLVLSPLDGTVLFAAGKQSWGFSLPQLSKLMAAKSGASEQALLSAMWGEVYFNPESGKWTNKPGAGRARGFCKLVAGPLLSAFSALHENVANFPAFKSQWLDPLGLSVAASGAVSAGAAMHLCLPLSDILVDTIRNKLPAPQTAQKYRAALLYPGASDSDAVYVGIRDCDSHAPLCIFVAKLTPTDTGGFWALGRVLSGTVARGDKVSVLPPEFDPVLGAAQSGVFAAVAVQALAVPKGANVENVDRVCAGSLVLLGGLDKYVLRTATVVAGVELSQARAVVGMKLTVSAVVAQSVRPKKLSDAASFSKALVKLGKTDSLVHIRYDASSQQTVIAGAGELHLEVVLGDLRRLCKFELLVGDPVVALRETCVGECESSLAKSSSKLNRVFAGCRPLAPSLASVLERGDDASLLLGQHPEWRLEKRKLWSAGGEGGVNVLSDDTRGVEHLFETQPALTASFLKLAQSGPLCGEPVHGCQFTVADVKLHADRAHRSDVSEAMRRACSGALLNASPRLMEPVLLATIEVPSELSSVVFAFLSRRQARVLSETPQGQGRSTTVVAHLAALESLGFDAGLRKASSGAAFVSLAFSHWEVVDSDPLQEGTRANKLMIQKRQLKALQPLDPASFVDKL